MSPRKLSLFLGMLLLVSALAVPAVDAQGRRVAFEATKFDDTLFASINTAYRVVFDDSGDIWYSTQAGVVHVDLAGGTREFFTHQEGLPSSYALGLAIQGNKVYVATDLGVGVIDRVTGNVTAYTPENSPLPDSLIQEVVLDGDNLWIGTYFQGVSIWNLTTDTWVHKNTSTTPRGAEPVRRMLSTASGVWVATEGDGVWKYDRSKGAVTDDAAWSVLLKEDGLPSNTVLAVAERYQNVYFGTDRGVARWAGYAPYAGTADEWLVYNTTHGLPHNRILDLDVIPTAEGKLDVFASTRDGLWQLEVESGANATRRQEFGLLGTFIFDDNYSARHGWAFATQRGVSLLRGGNWTYYTTGPSEGASPGPVSFLFTSGSVGDSGDLVWFGSGAGVSAFNPRANEGRGVWYNLGEWQYYPGSVVNHMDIEAGTVWIATNKGVFGFDPNTGEWTSKLARAPSRNLVYGVDADRGELWIALFGDGLLMQNLTTGVSRSWDATSVSSLPDLLLTDVRVQGDDVWLGAGIGVIRLNRVSGTVSGTYTTGDGIPGSGIVFRTLPDGSSVWVGTKDGGVARLNAATGKVDRVWNSTANPGFPGGEVRSLLRESGRLWVGTSEGLARINIATGDFKAYNQSSSGLVQNYINGINEADGILYLATLSGVARLDIKNDVFLPMRDGPDVVRNGGATNYTSPITVRIDTPKDGRAVTGLVEIVGRASQFGNEISRVEVRVGQGDWMEAEGTAQWKFLWNASTVRGETPIVARAFVGENVSREVEVLVTVVEVPTVPLTIEHTAPANATAGRPLALKVVARGDEPLSVSAFYKRPGQDVYTRMSFTRQASLFTAIIPAKDIREGELTYYVEARSGLLTQTSPTDPALPHRVPIGPPPRLAVAVEGPLAFTAKAGQTVAFDLNVTNTGSEPASFVLTALGLRASWVTMPVGELALAPGQTQVVKAKLIVPAAAFNDTTNLTFEARDTGGVAEPASATVPLVVVATAKATTTPTGSSGKGFFGIPGPTPMLLAITLVAVALVLRRRSS